MISLASFHRLNLRFSHFTKAARVPVTHGMHTHTPRRQNCHMSSERSHHWPIESQINTSPTQMIPKTDTCQNVVALAQIVLHAQREVCLVHTSGLTQS